MLPASIMNEDVTILRPSMVDARGTAEPDWDAASSHSLRGVSLQESDGAIDLSGRDASTTNATLYAMHGADIARGDRVIAHGRTWDVISEPRNMGPASKIPHTVATLREWVG